MPVTDHDTPARHRFNSPLLSVTSAVVAASIAVGAGAGAAYAAPGQGGTSPDDRGVGQGGTSPDDPGVSGHDDDSPAGSLVVPGPGSIPAPPQEAPYQPYTPPQSDNYQDVYTPSVPTPQAPKPTKPVRPIAPPVNKIRIGNFITDIPAGMDRRHVNSINAWAAYGESKIAQNLIAIGVPKDEASRRAAATIIGVAAGGATGAAVAGIPTAVLVGVPATVIGAVAGGLIGYATGGFAPNPVSINNAAIGAGIGAGIGVGIGAAAGAAAATVGATTGGLIGGALAYALGAGDPGANPAEPWRPGAPRHALPDTGPNQFEYHLPADQARGSGLPAVEYVVTHRGDVRIRVGATKLGWSAEQAHAPYALLGAGVEANVRSTVRAGSDTIKNLIPGATVDWPQEGHNQYVGKHRQ